VADLFNDYGVILKSHDAAQRSLQVQSRRVERHVKGLESGSGFDSMDLVNA
jgi:hypothetical protein